MIIESYIVKNKAGLQLWPAVELVSAIDHFESRVMLHHNGSQYNAKSILGLMSAMIRYGETVEFIVDGQDEEYALDVIRRVLIHLETAEEDVAARD